MKSNLYSFCVKLRLLILNTWETKSKRVVNHYRNGVNRRQCFWRLIGFLKLLIKKKRIITFRFYSNSLKEIKANTVRIEKFHFVKKNFSRFLKLCFAFRKTVIYIFFVLFTQILICILLNDLINEQKLIPWKTWTQFDRKSVNKNNIKRFLIFWQMIKQ